MIFLASDFTFQPQVDAGFFVVDSLIGYTMFVIIALLAFLGVPAILQVRMTVIHDGRRGQVPPRGPLSI